MDLRTEEGIHGLYARRHHQQLNAAAVLSGRLEVILNAAGSHLTDAAAIKRLRDVYAEYLRDDLAAKEWMPEEACCEGRPDGHEGDCWPIGGVRPAARRCCPTSTGPHAASCLGMGN